jgi:hypothetical protein
MVSLLEREDWSFLKWEDLNETGVSQKAVDTIRANGIPLERVFCHPMSIRKEPRLVLYYRNLACLPQKGMRRLGFPVEKYEEGEDVPTGTSVSLAKTINAFISKIVESDPKYNLDDARIAASMNFGSQINGSWRNAVGEEGARRIKQILMGFLREKKAIKTIRLMDGSTCVSEESPDIDQAVEIDLMNGYSVGFSSDPDIETKDVEGLPVCVVEIKPGLDPAGAYERYDAAKKSFEHALKRNKAVTTIYVSLLTPSVQKEIKGDRLVMEDYGITEILAGGTERDKFLARMFWLAHMGT